MSFSSSKASKKAFWIFLYKTFPDYIQRSGSFLIFLDKTRHLDQYDFPHQLFVVGQCRLHLCRISHMFLSSHSQSDVLPGFTWNRKTIYKLLGLFSAIDYSQTASIFDFIRSFSIIRLYSDLSDNSSFQHFSRKTLQSELFFLFPISVHQSESPKKDKEQN